MKLYKVVMDLKPVGIKIQHFVVDNEKELNNMKKTCEEGKLNKKILNYSIKELDIEKIKYEDFRLLVGIPVVDLAKLIKYIGG